jgi:hypothetical protein
MYSNPYFSAYITIHNPLLDNLMLTKLCSSLWRNLEEISVSKQGLKLVRTLLLDELWREFSGALIGVAVGSRSNEGLGLRLTPRPEASDRIPFDRVLIFEPSGRSLDQSQFLNFSWFWEELWFFDLFDFVIHHVHTASIGIKAKMRCIITPFLNPIGKFSGISKSTINSNSSCRNWSGNVSLPHPIYSFQIPWTLVMITTHLAPL